VKTSVKSNEFLLNRDDPNYPPHHSGDHLEEYFLKYWESEGNKNRKLIPVHWTAVYNYRAKEGFGNNTTNGRLRDELKTYLKSLDPKDKYFVVCTHDDAPSEDLPPDTLVFGAGGNSNRIDIPIPLTCGPHKDIEDAVRIIPMSFIGSLTHPIRRSLVQGLQNVSGVYLNAMEWSPEVPKDKVNIFKQVTSRSIFSLCPRGYGATSYRLYEAMQLGAIPVYVSDKHLLPWSDELDWREFCITVTPDQLPNILQNTIGSQGSIIRKIQDQVQRVWKDHFSIPATCDKILRRVR
jgi:hypothetical protein